MYLVMQVHTDADYDNGIHSVSLELTKQSIKWLLDRMKHAKELKKADHDFESLRYSYYPNWSGYEIEEEGDLEFKEELPTCDGDEELQFDIPRIAIYDDIVEMKCNAKETSTELVATSLGDDYLKKIYKVLTCPKEKLALLVNDENSVVKGILKSRCNERK